MLTDQQIHAFYDDLAKLMNKHGLRGFVGMAFINEEDSGIVQLHDPADTALKGVIEYTRTVLEVIVRENGGVTGGRVTGIARGDGKNN
jgi:hypothetical protein